MRHFVPKLLLLLLTILTVETINLIHMLMGCGCIDHKEVEVVIWSDYCEVRMLFRTEKG